MTATLAPTAGASVAVLQNTAGDGQVVLDDDAAGTPGTAFNGNGGGVTLTAGTGGITTANASDAFAEIVSAGAVSLVTAGGVGTSANRLQYSAVATPAVVSVGGAVTASGVYLDGLAKPGARPSDHQRRPARRDGAWPP